MLRQALICMHQNTHLLHKHAQMRYDCMRQWEVVRQLSSLYDQMSEYAQLMVKHQRAVTAHKAQFDTRLAELHAAQQRAQQDEGTAGTWPLIP